MFLSGHSVSLCCSVYRLCVTVYCTAATACHSNRSEQIYHIICSQTAHNSRIIPHLPVYLSFRYLIRTGFDTSHTSLVFYTSHYLVNYYKLIKPRMCMFDHVSVPFRFPVQNIPHKILPKIKTPSM